MNNKKAILFCSGMLACLPFSAVASEDKTPLVISSKGIPQGFEDLLAPQQSLVDIYYGGRFVASMSVTYTPDRVEFLDPDALVRQIPVILDAQKVGLALEGELDSHIEEICQRNQDTGCGIIEPEVAGVIFDETRFRADLFIHPDYLSVKAVDYNRYLPDSTAGPGLMQNITANISGDVNNSDGQQNYTIFGNSFLSYEENNIQANWDISRDQRVSVNQLLFERDYQGKQWQAGLIFGSGFGLNFSGSSRVWGARLASSFNTRTDRAFTQGTPLEVYMPVQGRYEIIFEERLIASGFLETGNQALDTSRFPGGAYDLTIRLLDEQGNLIREENRFFAKQNRLAPRGEPEYFVEAGRIAQTGANRVLPDLTDTYVARSGVNVRLADTWSGTFAAAATPGQTLGEASVFNIGRNYEVSTGLMVAGEKDYGLRGEGRYRLGALNLSANYLHLWRSNEPRNLDDYNLLGNAFRQLTLSANYPLLGGNASYRFSDNENRNNDNQESRQIRQTVAYSRPVYRDNLYTISVRFDTSWTSADDISGLLSVELRRTQNNWSFQATPQSRYNRDTNGDSETSHSLLLGATYDDRDTFAGSLRSTLRAEKSSGRTSAGVSTRYASTWGSSTVNLNYADSNGVSNTTYAASLSSSFTVNEDVVAFGGEAQSRSAVVINVDGAGLNERFNVYIDNQRRGYALGGKPSIVHLSPYQTYKVRIRPEGESLYSFDEREYQVTLYPGNVTALDYEVKQVLVVYGRVKTEQGDWLNHASVQGGEGLAVSDEFGVFQAEIAEDTEELIFNRRGDQCVLALTPEKYEDDFINLGHVTCKTTDS